MADSTNQPEVRHTMTRHLLVAAAALALVAGTACEPLYGARRTPAPTADFGVYRPPTGRTAANPVDSEVLGDVARTPATVTSPDDPPIGCPGCPPAIPTPPPVTVPADGWSWTRDGCSSGTFRNDGPATRTVLIQYGPRQMPLVWAIKHPGEVETVNLAGMQGTLGFLFVDGGLAESIDCR